jgi:small-conductance mechanosensitive channel
MNLEQVLNTSIYNNAAENWAISLLAIIIVWSVMALAWKFALKRLDALASRTDTIIDDAIVFALGKTNSWWMFIIGVYVGSKFVDLPQSAERTIHVLTILAVIFQGGLWLNAVLSSLLERSRARRIEKDPASVTMLSVIGFIGKFLLWSIVLLLVLDNLGFNITTLVAGLGVGGVSVGDFIVVDDMMGSVEYVGLKTTRVRSLSGEQLVFANSDLLSSRIRNYGRMYKRRVVFHIGVTYQTPRHKLEIIPGILREAVEACDKTSFDRSNFQKYGDYSIIFETVYFVLTPDYNTYMDIHETINLAIHRRFEEEGIEFAYPTQTVFVAGNGSRAET